ncbi:hypothetical protein B0A49_04017 [Cryomyces minteri]|uniref:Uncharacterized protein n=1 Tax=Cryomyces minteri TaxID=331657 RepID=A0A4U0XJU8_9PEZI|nr:hypothetical protein B0A49_04017 [Cryomyces minteri]
MSTPDEPGPYASESYEILSLRATVLEEVDDSARSMVPTRALMCSGKFALNIRSTIPKYLLLAFDNDLFTFRVYKGYFRMVKINELYDKSQAETQHAESPTSTSQKVSERDTSGLSANSTTSTEAIRTHSVLLSP